MKQFKNVDCTNCVVNDCLIARFCSSEWEEKINSCKIVAYYKKGHPIVKEDTIAMGIYIIHTGKVLIVSERENSGRQIIRLALPGDIIEHKESENKLKSPFTAEAFEDSIICYIPKAMFFQLLKENPQLTIRLERFYTNKFVKAENRLKNFMIMDARAKVADALLIVAETFDGKVPFSRKELGELIGISADQVSRELKKLMDSDIINKKDQNKRIAIKDFSRLLDIVKEYDQNYSISIKEKSAKKQKFT